MPFRPDIAYIGDSKLALMKKGLRQKDGAAKDRTNHSKLALMKKGLRLPAIAPLAIAKNIQNLP